MKILNFLKSYYLYISITLFGFILRVINIGFSNRFIMDEAYYVPDGYSIFKYGYEVRWLDKKESGWENAIDKVFASSDMTPYSLEYQSTHPPFGKMLIGLGMMPFSYQDQFGWRFSSLVFGTLIIILVMILSYLLFHNKSISILAGFIVSIDSGMIAMSRVGMLDIFITFFGLLGFIFVVKYIERYKIKYLVFMSISFGLALSIKWSGLYLFAGAILFILIKYILDKKIIKYMFMLVLSLNIMLTTYIITWIPWLLLYASKQKENLLSVLITSHINNFIKASGINEPHPYKTNAIEWIWIARPTALEVDFENNIFIYMMPNIIFWFLSLVSLVILIALIFKKELKYAVIILPVAVLMGWVPWFFTERTAFEFYVVIFLPYLYISLASMLYTAWIKISHRIIRISTMVIAIFILFFSALLYPTAVGLQLPQDNQIVKNYPRVWIKNILANNLYDVSQFPTIKDMSITKANKKWFLGDFNND